MSIYVPNSGNPANFNNNSSYGYYGQDALNAVSLELGSKNPQYGSSPIDTSETDPAVSGNIFAYNNDRPIGGRQTFELTNVSNKFLSNMSNIDIGKKTYPDQNLFRSEQTRQYIYNNNPRKDRIGVF